MTAYDYFVLSFCCLLAYLLGSIPFGLLLGKLFGAGDIRKIGSGNIGATNMLRTGRKGLAAATLLLDFLKGILGIAVAQGYCKYYFSTKGGDFYIAPSIVCFAGAAAVIGHIFPIWLRFRGGKGVATTLGVLLSIHPHIGLATMMGWLMIFYLTRISSLAAIGSIAGAPVMGYLYASREFFIMSLLLAVLVVYKHKDNIRRLRQGTEQQVGDTADESA